MKTNTKNQYRIYNADECCVFRKTKELYGGLSNMASGYPVRVNGIDILSSEALYQACRFPHLPDVQENIISQKSPMAAKMVCKPYRDQSRNDWEQNRVKIMRWCLRVKLAQNFLKFGELLESTLAKPIVEDSPKDPFWGAVRDKQDVNTLKGVNALGRLLMELRHFYNEKRYSYEMFVVDPLDIPDFRLYGRLVETIDAREDFINKIKILTHFDEIEKMPAWMPKSACYETVKTEQTAVKEPEMVSEKGSNKKGRKEIMTNEGQIKLPF